jgi:hypothetical protein
MKTLFPHWARSTRRLFRLVSCILVASGGLACLVAAIVWVGCASPASNAPPPSPTPTRLDGLFPTALRLDQFKKNVLFLQEANVPASEVYASFGRPDWESKELRLIAYRARNNQALFVSYGTNNLVLHYEVQKLKENDSLMDAACTWLKSY